MVSFACTRNWALGNTLLCTRGASPKGSSPRPYAYNQYSPWAYAKGEQAGYNRLEFGGTSPNSPVQHGPRSSRVDAWPCCKVLLVVAVSILLGSVAGLVLRKVPGAAERLDALQQRALSMFRHPEAPQAAEASVRATAPTSTRPLYSCGASSKVWASSSVSEAERAWCCQNFGQGCRHRSFRADPIATKVDRFECKIRERMEWNVKQTVWCCENRGLGCGTTRSPEHRLNCSDVPLRGRGAWSAAKKKACYEAFQMPIFASPTLPASGDRLQSALDPTDAVASIGDAAPPAEEEGTRLPVILGGVAPLRKAQGDSYDCTEDRTHWIAEWSPTKKAWCCRHRSFACPPEPGRMT